MRINLNKVSEKTIREIVSRLSERDIRLLISWLDQGCELAIGVSGGEISVGGDVDPCDSLCSFSDRDLAEKLVLIKKGRSA